MSNGPVVYDIDIPGVQDVIKIPALEDQALAQERAIRYATLDNPLPDWAQKVQHLANMLDDAQDMLFVGLTLAKPLLLKLPARLLPGVGWLLLANDLLNIGTALASVALTGRISKNARKQVADAITGTFGRKARNPATWLRAKTDWFSFGVQAGQVTDNLTGYGLQLGGVMGMISGTVFGAIKQLGGERVEYRAPPPSDIASKAARFLSQSPGSTDIRDYLSPEDHLLIQAAQHFAVQILTPAMSPALFLKRQAQVKRSPHPIGRPWNPVTREALASIDVDPDGGTAPFTRAPNPRPTTSEVVSFSTDHRGDWELAQKDIYGPNLPGSLAYVIASDTAERALNTTTIGGWLEPDRDDPLDRTLGGMIEFGLFPPDWPDPAIMEDRIARLGAPTAIAQSFSVEKFRAATDAIFARYTAAGRRWPTAGDVATVIRDTYGSVQERNPV